MRKEYIYLAGFSTLIACIIFSCLVLIFTGVATPFISSFAVDGANRLYVGTQDKIQVYADNSLIDTINPKTSRSYVFTINDDEKIILSTSTKIYTMDLEGNVLDTQTDLGAHMYNKIQYNKRGFLSQSGDEYRLVSELGWTRIVKNGRETVFKISLLSFFVKILIAVCAVALFIFPLWAANQKKKTGDGLHKTRET